MGSSVVLSTNLNSRQFPVGRNCHGDVVVKFCQLVSILYRSVRCFCLFGGGGKKMETETAVSRGAQLFEENSTGV